MAHLLLHKTPNSVSSEPGAAHTEDITVEETTEEVSGTLYILPEGKRFELLRNGGLTIKGKLARSAVEALVDEHGDVRQGLLGTQQNIQVKTRQTRIHSGEPHRSYTLLAVAGMEHPS